MTTRDKLNYEVDFDPSKAGDHPKDACTPDPLPVKASTLITWKMKQSGYTFTGVQIDGNTYTPQSSPSGEFNSLQIGSDGGKSTMSIVDTIADRNSHSYTLLYVNNAAPGTPLSYDPTIQNEN